MFCVFVYGCCACTLLSLHPSRIRGADMLARTLQKRTRPRPYPRRSAKNSTRRNAAQQTHRTTAELFGMFRDSRVVLPSAKQQGRAKAGSSCTGTVLGPCGVSPGGLPLPHRTRGGRGSMKGSRSDRCIRDVDRRRGLPEHEAMSDNFFLFL